jgi:hypothetical protein
MVWHIGAMIEPILRYLPLQQECRGKMRELPIHSHLFSSGLNSCPPHANLNALITNL